MLLAQGDTLRGEIEDNGWDDAPAQVRFRPAAGAASHAYAPAELRAFRLTGGRYFRYETLPLDRAAKVELNSLPYRLVRNPQPEALLVEVLVEGPASLLRTAVNDVQHYYVRREGRPVLEMAERRYIRQKNDHQYVTDGNNYQAELLGYFGECPAAVQAIGLFRAPALVAVVQAYNQQCATPPRAGTEYRPLAHQLAFGFAIGLLVGGRYGSCLLQAQSPSATTLNGANLDGVIHPVGGVFVDVLAPGCRSAMHLAGMVTQIGRRGLVATPGGGPAAQVANKFAIMELRAGGRFFWGNTQREQRFFAGAGVTLGYALTYQRPMLIYYDASQQPLAGSEVPEAYPHSSLLPYLEIGAQQGRLTLAMDGRIQRQEVVQLLSLPAQPQGGLPYTFSPEDYTYRNWYLGATLGFTLLRER